MKEKFGIALMLGGALGVIVSFVFAFPHFQDSFNQIAGDQTIIHALAAFSIVTVGLVVGVPLVAIGSFLAVGDESESEE